MRERPFELLQSSKHGPDVMQANLMRAAVEALGHMSAAMDTRSWPPAVQPFTSLLSLSLDSRPKVRKIAQQAVANVKLFWMIDLVIEISWKYVPSALYAMRCKREL